MTARGKGYLCDDSGWRCIKYFDKIDATEIQEQKMILLTVFQEQDLSKWNQ